MYHKTDRTTVIGLIAGYLLKVDKNKGRICLDPRSCRLIGFFAPIQQNLDLPLKMGEEDKVALLCSPENLGAATYWNQRVWNMTRETKYAQIQTDLNNADVVWNNNKVPQNLLLRIKEITSGDINSCNKEDIQEQQQLWLDLMELVEEKTIHLQDFDTWIMSDARTVSNEICPVLRVATLHPVLHFLQDANRLDPDNGLWKLWPEVDPTAERAVKNSGGSQEGRTITTKLGRRRYRRGEE